jgi:hypothetical protein
MFLGTRKDNVEDMVSKGRQAKGEKQGNHKLTEQDVIIIRGLLSLGHTLRSIAENFGVDFTNISAIKRRKTWKHLP